MLMADFKEVDTKLYNNTPTQNFNYWKDYIIESCNNYSLRSPLSWHAVAAFIYVECGWQSGIMYKSNANSCNCRGCGQFKDVTAKSGKYKNVFRTNNIFNSGGPDDRCNPWRAIPAMIIYLNDVVDHYKNANLTYDGSQILAMAAFCYNAGPGNHYRQEWYTKYNGDLGLIFTNINKESGQYGPLSVLKAKEYGGNYAWNYDTLPYKNSGRIQRVLKDNGGDSFIKGNSSGGSGGSGGSSNVQQQQPQQTTQISAFEYYKGTNLKVVDNRVTTTTAAPKVDTNAINASFITPISNLFDIASIQLTNDELLSIS